jgi:hypothetical protein
MKGCLTAAIRPNALDTSLVSVCVINAGRRRIRGRMWTVTEREAAAIYARACLSWYGHHCAKSVARSMVRKLSTRCDLNGVKAWRLVSEELVRLERERMSQPFESKMRAQA